MELVNWERNTIQNNTISYSDNTNPINDDSNKILIESALWNNPKILDNILDDYLKRQFKISINELREIIKESFPEKYIWFIMIN